MATLRITSDGDPYPLKAGTGSNFSNYGVTDRSFATNSILDQSHDFTFTYRAGSNTKDPELASTIAPIGITNTGIPIFTAGAQIRTLPVSSGSAPTGYTWNEVALPNDFVVDICSGKPDENGQYTYRSGAFYTKGMVGNTKLFASNAYYSSTQMYGSFGSDKLRHGATSASDTVTSGHSKIIGFAFDGYPIYGPYGFIDPNNAGSIVTRMRSSYDLLSLPALGRGYDYSVFPAGSFIEDYVYNAQSSTGTLDEFNGRYCVTPDYKTGTYAYFLTFEDINLQIPEYPYIIGPSTREQRTA